MCCGSSAVSGSPLHPTNSIGIEYTSESARESNGLIAFPILNFAYISKVFVEWLNGNRFLKQSHYLRLPQLNGLPDCNYPEDRHRNFSKRIWNSEKNPIPEIY